MSTHYPSGIAVLLAAALAGTEQVAADQIRDQLSTLGFTCSTQHVVASLGRICRKDLPHLEPVFDPSDTAWKVTESGRFELFRRELMPLRRDP